MSSHYNMRIKNSNIEEGAATPESIGCNIKSSTFLNIRKGAREVFTSDGLEYIVWRGRPSQEERGSGDMPILRLCRTARI